jgi:TonB family protein
MNNVSKLVAFILLTSLVGVSGLRANNKWVEREYVKSFQGRTDMPVPLKVVSPEAVSDIVGQVYVQFVVSETGRPTQIIIKACTDHALVDSVLAAVSRWTFAPATIDGVPVPKTLILPVHFKTEQSPLASSWPLRTTRAD